MWVMRFGRVVVYVCNASRQAFGLNRVASKNLANRASMGSGSPCHCAASNSPQSKLNVKPREPMAAFMYKPSGALGTRPVIGKRSCTPQRTPAQPCTRGLSVPTVANKGASALAVSGSKACKRSKLSAWSASSNGRRC